MVALGIGAGTVFALAVQAQERDDDTQRTVDDVLSWWPPELGRPSGELLQKLRTVPFGIHWMTWLDTAQRLGVDLLERPDERGGVTEERGVVVEGFRFDPSEYPALAGFEPTGPPAIMLSEGLVQYGAGFRKGDGPKVVVGLEVGQRTPVALRRHFLGALLAPDSTGGRFPPPASAIGITVGDAATAGEAPAGTGDDRYVTDISFYRRTVMVSLSQEGPALDLGALARAIDQKIQARPTVRNLESSKLRPRITYFKMEGASAQDGEVVEGSAEWEDPQQDKLTVEVRARSGSASISGTKVEYNSIKPGPDTISLRVANSLNLSDQSDFVIVIR